VLGLGDNMLHDLIETSEHTDTFFHHGTSGHWKDILSPDQAKRIESDHREVMEQYGYLASNVREIYA